jgi:tetratricopeptide (TPR) repeat protein
MSDSDSLELLDRHYRAGKAAFERGQYRQSIEQFEQAVSLVAKGTAIGGEMQIWLVTAYQAAGQDQQAIALCQKLEAHPDLSIRKQSRRLSYILKAPKLQTRPEWFSQIPDLSTLDSAEAESKGASRFTGAAPKAPARPRPQSQPQPIDLSQVNTQDNGFIWLAIGGAVLLLGGLIWFS